jgi:hypothetical protein
MGPGHAYFFSYSIIHAVCKSVPGNPNLPIEKDSIFIVNSFHPQRLAIYAFHQPIQFLWKGETKTMGELKSALEIAMEKSKKMGGDEEVVRLSSNQKNEIAEIRKVYAAKIAEAEILIQEKEKQEKEIDRLKRERERKIEAVYQKEKGK